MSQLPPHYRKAWWKYIQVSACNLAACGRAEKAVESRLSRTEGIPNYLFDAGEALTRNCRENKDRTMNRSDTAGMKTSLASRSGPDPPMVPAHSPRTCMLACSRSRRNSSATGNRAALVALLQSAAGCPGRCHGASGHRRPGSAFTPHPAAPSSVQPSLRDQPMVAAPSPTRSVPRDSFRWRRSPRATGQRCRVTLPDDSVLSVNQNTAVHYDALRHLTLKAGEIFMEAAPQLAAAPRLSSRWRRRIASSGLGTKFLCGPTPKEPGFPSRNVRCMSAIGMAAQRRSTVRTESGCHHADAAPSYLLDWTRDLVASATPSLVPAKPTTAAPSSPSIPGAKSEPHAAQVSH